MAIVIKKKGRGSNVDMAIVNQIKQDIEDGKDISVSYAHGSVPVSYEKGLLSGGHFRVLSVLNMAGIKVG